MRRPSPAVLAAVVVVSLTAACGKKGPPLPPLRPLPVAPTDVTARRVGDRVQLRFVVPDANQDPSTPVSISRVDVYARSLGYGSEPPVHSQLLLREFLVGSVDVRPPANPDAPPADPAAPVDPRPAPGSPASWSETMPLSAGPPLRLNREQQAAAASRRPLPFPLAPTAVTVPFTRISLPTRYYTVVGVSGQGRPGTPSLLLQVRLGGEPPVPTEAKIAFTETTLTLTWVSPRGAGVSVYESTRDGVEQVAPVQAAPITTGTWSTPVTFGVERCFTIRQVQVNGPVSTESAPAGPLCVTPVDTYPPPAPAEPRGAAEPGRITLEWDAVTAPDLAGYHILRAEGAGATLQQLTKSPEPASTFVDLTARAGVEYTYVVVAVDRAGNLSAQSAPVRLTGR